ncbi:hypothetical protein A9X03_21050 [Mycobacterium sp. E1715]|uniref:hypothetical protein n=1 Tax=Mycobacterium sp. E1715 TaxID=1856863 RepID=UPI0007FD5B13|nr:hypothetical protein [Mycobacterium sp. E1715]OBH16567.1 hypothetical protein A9X03_21050 [Mycobacterium sp. E1715]
MSGRAKLLIAVAVGALLAGSCGAIAYGFWAVSQDCREWVAGNGYRLVHDDWWAKSRGCLARTPAGDAVTHSEGLASKATGWAWQLAIFGAGALPAAVILARLTFRWRADP